MSPDLPGKLLWMWEKLRKKGFVSIYCYFDAIFSQLYNVFLQITLLEKHKRKFAERKRNTKQTSMTKISIEGARMDLG